MANSASSPGMNFAALKFSLGTYSPMASAQLFFTNSRHCACEEEV
jgi:hypothetical protein